MDFILLVTVVSVAVPERNSFPAVRPAQIVAPVYNTPARAT